jgi:hypothetical protein
VIILCNFAIESGVCYCCLLNRCVFKVLLSGYRLLFFVGVCSVAMKQRAIGLLCMTARQLACSFVLIGWRSLIS